jgi:hypothetical protein
MCEINERSFAFLTARPSNNPGTPAIPRVGSGKSRQTLEMQKFTILAITTWNVPECSLTSKGSGEMPAGIEDCSFVQVTVLEGGQRVGGRASTALVRPH